MLVNMRRVPEKCASADDTSLESMPAEFAALAIAFKSAFSHLKDKTAISEQPLGLSILGLISTAFSIIRSVRGFSE